MLSFGDSGELKFFAFLDQSDNFLQHENFLLNTDKCGKLYYLDVILGSLGAE